MKQPSFSVYSDRKTSVLTISKQFLDENGLHCDSGPFLEFTPEQMKEIGVTFSERHFAEFEGGAANAPSEFQMMSEEKQAAFYKGHKHVWVCRRAPNEIVMSPWRPVRRGKKVVLVALGPEENIHVPWPTTAEKFFEGLMAALEKVP
jgi:hypothetical protein